MHGKCIVDKTWVGRKMDVEWFHAGRRDCILCGDAGAAGECIEGNSLTEEDLAHWAADCGAVVDGSEGGAFAYMPLHSGGYGKLGVQVRVAHRGQLTCSQVG